MANISYVDWDGISRYDARIKQYILDVVSSGAVMPDDSTYYYVDWQGLAHYDSNIKTYIESRIDDALLYGGSVSYDELPTPSESTLHYIYILTETFQATADKFVTPGKFQKNTVVVCVAIEGTYLYSILFAACEFDPSQYYTRTDVDKSIEMLHESIKSDFVSKSDLYEEELILQCGDASDMINTSIVDIILSNELPAIKGIGDQSVTTEWAIIDDLSTWPVTRDGFYTQENGTAGYQIYFTADESRSAQHFALPKNAIICAAYRYDAEGTHSWLPTEPPPSFEWKQGDLIMNSVNGTDYEYQGYIYDIDNMGESMITNESWRFEFKE